MKERSHKENENSCINNAIKKKGIILSNINFRVFIEISFLLLHILHQFDMFCNTVSTKWHKLLGKRHKKRLFKNEIAFIFVHFVVLLFEKVNLTVQY